MRIVAISDTHTKHNQFDIPDGDVLIHAGDFTSRGKQKEIRRFNNFLGTLPHKHKVVIAGNHDFALENEPELAEPMLTNCTYLRDSSIVIEGVKIYGSPWQPEFFNWAFNLPRGEPLKEKWEQIPDDTDILITHGPPYGILDKTARGEHVGCEELIKIVLKKKPAYHIFGHIHEAAGEIKQDGIHFINASLLNLQYKPAFAPTVFDIQTQTEVI
ncbi:MAG: metallophosphoesterase [Deltaproteobacteria bacterium]|nr:metallophosphoesterase [Deltaproteobacteria bacterium]MBU50934.1 metallophosphoesterase [Deltaproteobacteria bacterium]|tara:strand:- start:8133 stop:8774 length:642 start_codon:yes stop_codon:yes gene_type:complete